MCNMLCIQCSALHLEHWIAAMKNEGESFKKAVNSKHCVMNARFRRQIDKRGKIKTK